MNKNGYRKHLKPKCESCGFVPIHSCQLDVHHDDLDHDNNHPDNLRTFCANCHRLMHVNPDELPDKPDFSFYLKQYIGFRDEFLAIKEAFDPSI